MLAALLKVDSLLPLMSVELVLMEMAWVLLLPLVPFVDLLNSELEGSYGVFVTFALVFLQVLRTSFLALSFSKMWKIKMKTPGKHMTM